MYARKFRVPVREFFEKKAGIRVHTPHFTLLVQETGLGYNRVAVVIKGKTKKGAVGRHTLKRKTINETKKWQNHENTGKDFVIITKPNSEDLNKQELKEELSELWQKYLRS